MTRFLALESPGLWHFLQMSLLLPGNEFLLGWRGQTVLIRGAILWSAPPWLGQTGVWCDESSKALLEGALGLQEGDDDKEWDTGHGGESQEPSNGVSPRRIHVDIVVLERCVLAQGEEESGLKGRGAE